MKLLKHLRMYIRNAVNLRNVNTSLLSIYSLPSLLMYLYLPYLITTVKNIKYLTEKDKMCNFISFITS